MSFAIRMVLLGGLGLAAFAQTGCNMVPRYQLQQAQYRTRQLYDQNRALTAERNGLVTTPGLWPTHSSCKPPGVGRLRSTLAWERGVSTDCSCAASTAARPVSRIQSRADMGDGDSFER